MNIEHLKNTFIIIFKWIAFIFFYIASCCKNVCVVCLNYSKSVVELLLSAIKKTDHVISPNQTVSYKSRFYHRGLLKVSWQKNVFEKPKSGDIKKRHPRWRLAGSLRPYESKSAWKTKSWEKKTLQDDSLLGAWGLLFLVQPNFGGPPWRLHNDLPSTSKVRKGRLRWVIIVFYSKLRLDFNQPFGSTWFKK